MNRLQFLLAVLALFVACGISRGSEWRRMPIGPVETDANSGEPWQEPSQPAVVASAPASRDRVSSENNKDATRKKAPPGLKDGRRWDFPVFKNLRGRMRSQD